MKHSQVGRLYNWYTVRLIKLVNTFRTFLINQSGMNQQPQTIYLVYNALNGWTSCWKDLHFFTKKMACLINQRRHFASWWSCVGEERGEDRNTKTKPCIKSIHSLLILQDIQHLNKRANQWMKVELLDKFPHNLFAILGLLLQWEFLDWGLLGSSYWKPIEPC